MPWRGLRRWSGNVVICVYWRARMSLRDLRGQAEHGRDEAIPEKRVGLGLHLEKTEGAHQTSRRTRGRVGSRRPPLVCLPGIQKKTRASNVMVPDDAGPRRVVAVVRAPGHAHSWECAHEGGKLTRLGFPG